MEPAVAVRILVPALAGLLLAGCGRTNQSPRIDLNYDRLSGPLGTLNDWDREVVRDAIGLIQKGEHGLALVRLSSLNEKNPQNSSLRTLGSYALLQTGNLVGAFEEAERAHAAPDGSAYKCWFLGKVGLLNRNKDVSERELSHVRESGDMKAEAAQLEQEIRAN